MKILKSRTVIIFIFLLILSLAIHAQDNIEAAYNCLSRTIKKDSKTIFDLKIKKDNSQASYFNYQVEDGKLHITASSPVDLTRGAYDYLSHSCHSLVSWSGNNILIPQKLPQASKTLTSPFPLRYYLNVVTHGYSTPYWDWPRWEKEIDWMAVHGINMPLLPGAHEAILTRVFKKLGMINGEIKTYFTGPAHLPWNRMGNMIGWDGPLPDSYLEKQVKLFHKILDRSKELGMKPIIPVFAGFVPPGIKRLYPHENLRELKYGSFNKKYKAFILDPHSQLFNKIGRMFIEEWEKEFGHSDYYLADSFNEMIPPLSKDSIKALEELKEFGIAVYNSIHDANPDATWVMQGWTFPCIWFKDESNKPFWTPERLNALLSGVPDDKLLILDITNEYTRLDWNVEVAWKMYRGFYGKKWIFAYIPTLGGSNPYNGSLDLYASMSIEALQYENSKKLVGFGFAPEGIENNDIIYELLSDMAWRTQPIDLPKWIEHYCANRYGSCPESMKIAFEYFRKSVYGDFVDETVYQYQYGPISNKCSYINKSEDFSKGVEAFLFCKDMLKNSELYKNDLIELITQYLGLKADKMLIKFKKETKETDYALLDEAFELLMNIDRLLESHPNHRLERWVSFARNFGDTEQDKDYFESNAKRLKSTWGCIENTDYAAIAWSGLIRDYYIPRWKLYYDFKRKNEKFDIYEWEENWITTPGISKVEPFADPIESACELFEKNSKSDK